MQPLNNTPARFHFIVIALLAAVGIAAYANTFSVPYVFDDYENVRDNPHLRVQFLGWQELTEAMREGPSLRRPIAKLTFALNYYFGAENVWGYHAVNLAIHLACGVLVYLLGCDIFQRAALSPTAARGAALAAALIFVSHPLQTQAVTYIVQRMTCLAAMFYLAALLCYVRGREHSWPRRVWWWIGAVVCGLLALGSKEIAATLPMAILLYEAYFFQNLNSRWLKRTVVIVVPILVLLVAIVLLSPAVRAELFGTYSLREFTMGERLLTQPRVVLHYLSLVLWPLPSRLSITHDFPVSHGLFDPSATIPSMLFVAGLVVFAVRTARRWPFASFSILWILLHLAIESSVIPLEMAYEHRMYLPMAGVGWLAGWAVFAFLPGIRCATAIAAGIVLLLTVATHERNETWRDEVTLWTDVVAKYPSDARANNNLGSALASQGRHTEAIAHHRRALELKPGFANAHNNLGIALTSQGDMGGAIDEYLSALVSDPQYAIARNNLGNALASRGDAAAAAAQYRLALETQPDYADAHYNLAAALAAQGNSAEASEHYRAALRFNPRYYQAANNLGALLAAEGKLDEAAELLQHAVELKPDYLDALANLGSVLAWQERTPEARQLLQRALNLALAQGNEAPAAAIRERLQSLPE